MDEKEDEINIPINTDKYTFREKVFLGIIVILMIGFALVVYIEKIQIEQYNKPLNRCLQALEYATNGYIADQNMINIPNTTVIENDYR